MGLEGVAPGQGPSSHLGLTTMSQETTEPVARLRGGCVPSLELGKPWPGVPGSLPDHLACVTHKHLECCHAHVTGLWSPRQAMLLLPLSR